MKKTHTSDNKDKEIFEFTDLIQKEKEEALRRFRKQEFSSRLKQRIKEEESKTLSPSVFWFRKPVIASGLILLLIAAGWIAVQLFTPTAYERDAKSIKKTLSQAFETHELVIAQSVPPIESQPGSDNLYEFEWSLKRVIYSAQRENIPDSDIPKIFSQVLLKAAQFREAEDQGPEELKDESEFGHIFEEKNPQQIFDQIED